MDDFNRIDYELKCISTELNSLKIPDLLNVSEGDLQRIRQSKTDLAHRVANLRKSINGSKLYISAYDSRMMVPIAPVYITDTIVNGRRLVKYVSGDVNAGWIDDKDGYSLKLMCDGIRIDYAYEQSDRVIYSIKTNAKNLADFLKQLHEESRESKVIYEIIGHAPTGYYTIAQIGPDHFSMMPRLASNPEPAPLVGDRVIHMKLCGPSRRRVTIEMTDPEVGIFPRRDI